MRKKHRSGPTAASLRDIPEVDFGGYGRGRRNPFWRRMRAEGWQLVHEEPAPASLHEMPEIDGAASGRKNPYATRIKASGIELQVGRGRPRAGSEVGPTQVKSVRLPPAVWKRLEKRARAEGIALHALVRAALVDWLEKTSAA